MSHLIANIDGVGKAFGIGSTMTFDHHALQAQQHPAIGLLGVHLVAQGLEGAAGEQIADARQQASPHRLAQQLRDLPRGSLGGLQRDVAGKAFGDDHVGQPLADAVALDEADIIELRQVHRAQQLVGRSMLNSTLAIALPITASRARCCASPPMVAPRSSTTESPRRVGHTAAIAGRSIPGSVRRLKRAIAISAPVLPADTATSASPFLTASIASHIEDVLRPRRNAWLGLSCMLTATSVWMTREAAFIAGCLTSCASINARSPNSRNSASGCRVNEIAAPGMTTDAPTSPPMASSAIRTF